MLSSSIRNRMFTSRNLKKCALLCTTRVQYRFCRFAIFPVLRLDCFGQHRNTPYVYINATISKEQMQTKYSDVINFYSIIAGYCCSLHPPLYCPGLYRPCFAFLLWMTRSKWSTSPGTFVFDL